METNNKKSKDLFQEYPADQRESMLRDNAVNVTEDIVTRNYTQEEISQFKDELAEDSIQLSIEKAEFEKIKKAHEAKIKPIVDSIVQTTKKLRLKYSESLEDVFMMDDQEAGVMQYFDKNGKFVRERKLYPNERQLNIASVNKAV